MDNRGLSRIVSGVLVTIVVFVGGALPVAAGAQNGSSYDSVQKVAFHEGDHLALEHALQRLTLVLQIQSDRLSLANLTVSQTREWIAKLQNEGKGTAELESAVSAFEIALASGQAAHDNAQSTADGKAGFDANGQVSDEIQARQTTKRIRDGIRSCAETVNPAAKSLREGVRAYRESLGLQNAPFDEAIPALTITP